MIRVAPMRMPDTRTARSTQVMLPDGLNHTRFQVRKAGTGYYVYCSREAVLELLDRGKFWHIYVL